MSNLAAELAMHHASAYPYIQILTWEEERAQRLVREAAAIQSCEVQQWSAAQGMVKGGKEGNPIGALRAIQEGPAGFFILKDFHAHLGDPLVVRLMRDLAPEFAAAKKTVILVTPIKTIPGELEKEIAIVDLPLPRMEDLREVFHAILVEEKILFPEEFTDRVVAAALGLTEKEAGRVFRKALKKGGGFTLDDVSLVIEEKKRLLAHSDMLEFYDLDNHIDDVGGLQVLKGWLSERLRAFSDDARKFGLPVPKGLLLLGVQGCGKSLTAKAIAHHWKFPLLRLDLGAAMANNQAEAGLRHAIKVSESLAPAVLWVDEIEKGFSGIDAEAGEIDARAVRAFGGFITWLQEKKAPVFVVATANNVTTMPPELLRKGRFDEIFFVDLPDIHERAEILRIHLRKRARDPGAFDTHYVAGITEHFSGAELEQIVISALYTAYAQKREVTNKDMEKACKETVPLYYTYEEQIKALRAWAKKRARLASHDVTLLDYFKTA